MAITLAIVIPALTTPPVSWVAAHLARQLSAERAQAAHLASTDPLTGLIDRQTFCDRGEAILHAACAAHETVSLLVFDLDFCEDLNNHYGHTAGDEALTTIASVLRDTLRQDDLAGRLDGAAFAVLIKGITEREAQPLAQRVLNSVAARPLSLADSIIECSLSCGIADATSGDSSTAGTTAFAHLLKRAQRALKNAKATGRNRVASGTVFNTADNTADSTADSTA